MTHSAVVLQEVSSVAHTSGSAMAPGAISMGYLPQPLVPTQFRPRVGVCPRRRIRFQNLNVLPQVFSVNLGVRRILVPQFTGLPLR
jgi:hypothetical protein